MEKSTWINAPGYSQCFRPASPLPSVNSIAKQPGSLPNPSINQFSVMSARHLPSSELSHEDIGFRVQMPSMTLTAFAVVHRVSLCVNMKNHSARWTVPQLSPRRLCIFTQTDTGKMEPFLLTLCTSISNEIGTGASTNTHVGVVTRNHGAVTDIAAEAVSRLVWVDIFDRLVLHGVGFIVRFLTPLLGS